MKRLLCILALSLATPTFAATKDDVLAAGDSTQIGRAIADEVDARDLGFGDTQVQMEMILTNAAGDQSRREIRTKTLENTDPNDGDKGLTVFNKPRDVKGTAFLSYAHFLENDDQWLYLPALKRVKRISSKNKSGPFMGSEFSYEDLTASEMNKYTYDYHKTEACDDSECFVVERFPIYKDSGYTRQLTWIDTDKFIIRKVEFYDRKNALLKTLEMSDYTQYLNQYWRAHTQHMVNHITNKKTTLYFKDFQFKTGLTDKDFNQAVLKRAK